MPVDIDVQLRGADALQRRIDALPAKIERSVFRKALRSTGNKIARRLRAGTPRGETGLSKRMVKVKVKSTNTEAFARIAYRGRRAAIMGMYERGTVRQIARPFFDQATSGWEREARRDFEVALERAVSGAELKLEAVTDAA